MKRFIRTTLGKTTLVITLNITAILFVVCIVSAGFAYQTNMYFLDFNEVVDFILGANRYYKYGFYESILSFLYSWKIAVIPLSVFFLISSIFLFVIILSVCGRRPETEDVVPPVTGIIPMDFLLIVFIAALALIADILFDGFRYSRFIVTLIGGSLCGVAAFNIILFFIMYLATEIKLKAVIKSLLTLRIIKCLLRVFKAVWQYTKSFFSNVPLVWKTSLILTIMCIVEFLIIAPNMRDGEIILFAWFLSRLILVPLVIYLAISLRKLQKAGEVIAAGDLSYRIPEKGLVLDLLKHARNLNNISGSIAIAVEDRMKSERMKTELITNVSHDIKTPLTSIINYATLLGKLEKENDTAKEYSEILIKQSDRLKRLIEDLVEASKASSGSLEIHNVPCLAQTFISQSGGEYEEKLSASGLTLICSAPESDITIMADSQRMWRVFDNLMSNVCKYSQRETRVYLSLEKDGGKAVFTLKNTSKDALNISADELIERFVRGDSSRNTEGNGLGLSISKSLTELMGGEFKISVDGDLFKVILWFDVLED